MVNARRLVGFSGKRENFAKLADGIRNNPNFKRAILEEARRADVAAEELEASIEVSERKGGVEKLASKAIRVALSEIDPIVNFALTFNLDGVIDRIVPHKDAARHIKGFVNAVQGRGYVAVINLSETKEDRTKAAEHE